MRSGSDAAMRISASAKGPQDFAEPRPPQYTLYRTRRPSGGDLRVHQVIERMRRIEDE